MALSSYVGIHLTPREKTELRGLVENAFRHQECKWPAGTLAAELHGMIAGETDPPAPPKP